MTGADEVVARSVARAGLSDFGAAGWQEGLDRFLAAAATDLAGDDTGRTAVEAMAVGRLVNRLRIEDWYAREGSAAALPVEGPVVIFGLPRTATTALHYLLAVDPQLRFQRRWEVSDPVPPPALETEPTDPRRVGLVAAPSAQHIATADGPFEDGPVLALDFHHQEMGLPLPTYTRWWRTCDTTTTYAYHERVLRMLHAHRPPHRWLLKAPSYSFHLPQLARQYPGARFIMTHRDPVTVLGSTCSVVSSAQQMVLPSHHPDPVALGAFQLEHWVDAMDLAMAGRAEVGEDRFLDIYQQDFQHDPMAVVDGIYAFLGLELAPPVRAAMAEWSQANQRGARGEHHYSVEEFGQTEAAVRQAFSRYIDRYSRVTA
jgi:hypothetical protein